MACEYNALISSSLNAAYDNNGLYAQVYYDATKTAFTRLDQEIRPSFQAKVTSSLAASFTHPPLEAAIQINPQTRVRIDILSQCIFVQPQS